MLSPYIDVSHPLVPWLCGGNAILEALPHVRYYQEIPVYILIHLREIYNFFQQLIRVYSLSQ